MAKKKPQYNMLQCVSFMIRKAWRTVKSVLFICLAMIVLSVLQNLAQLFIAPMILSKVEISAPIGELLATIIVFTAVIFVLNGLSGYFDENYIFGRIDIRSSLTNDVNRKICKTSYPNLFDQDFIENREKALDNLGGNSSAGENIWTTLTNLSVSLIGFVIYLLLLSDTNIFLILIVLVTSVAAYFCSRYSNEWDYRHAGDFMKYRKHMAYITHKAEAVSLAKDIRIFGLASWVEDIHNAAMRAYNSLASKGARKYFISDLADVILTFARNGIAYFYLINMALKDGLPASQFLLYFTAISGFTTWVTNILAGFSTLHKECLGISSLLEFLNRPEQFRFEGGRAIPDTDKWEITFDNVTFRYPGSDEDIIKNMNLTIKSGEKLAVVGLNGAGKTTLVRLICGFFDPDEGRVLLNGTDIRNFNRDEYYTKFSAIFQDFSELPITVAESVAQNSENIDRDRVAACLDKSGLTKQIAKYEKGIDTHIGREVFLDGELFSGGQTQRLMLARALYKDAPILILDEPTAALDPLAEHDIYMKYNDMTQSKTSVFISHRLASTRFCDRIIFLADGNIKEEGTHETLLSLGGEYAKLFHVQSRYYQEGSEFNAEEI